MAPFGPLYFGRETPRSPVLQRAGIDGRAAGDVFRRSKADRREPRREKSSQQPALISIGDDREEWLPGSSFEFD